MSWVFTEAADEKIQLEERIGELEAENARLKTELRPWEMLQEMVARMDELGIAGIGGHDCREREYECLRLVSFSYARNCIVPGWIEARYNEWRERFPQEASE
jgi:hypothetical protein